MQPIYKDLEDKCKKTVEHHKKELGRVRTGRAHTSLLEGVSVDYYGSQVPLIQMGMVNAPEPRMITVQVFDASAVEAVEKAIQSSELGLNPSRDGSLLRINIPALTEERRKELIKKMGKMAEESKVTLRNHRREAIDAMKKKEKDKELSADDVKRGEGEVQKILDKYTKEIDVVTQAKEKEMMEV